MSKTKQIIMESQADYRKLVTRKPDECELLRGEIISLKEQLAKLKPLVTKAVINEANLNQAPKTRLKWREHVSLEEAALAQSPYLVEARGSSLSETKTQLFNLVNEDLYETELMASKSRSLPFGNNLADIAREVAKSNDYHSIAMFNCLNEISIGANDPVVGEDLSWLKASLFEAGLDAKQLVDTLKKAMLPAQAKKAVQKLRKARASGDQARILDTIAGVLAHILSDSGIDL